MVMVLRPFSESRCCNPSPPTDMLFSCVFPQIQCILRSFTKEGSSRTGRDFACYTVQYSRKVKTYIHTSSAPPTIGSQTQRGTCRNCALRCLDESLFSSFFQVPSNTNHAKLCARSSDQGLPSTDFPCKYRPNGQEMHEFAIVCLFV